MSRDQHERVIVAASLVVTSTTTSTGKSGRLSIVAAPTAPASARFGVSLAAATAIAILLLLPMIATDRAFGQDWPLHLWLTEMQRRAIAAGGFPSAFSHFREVGHFYPTGIFLGGPFYAVTGYISLAVGSATRGFILVQVIACASAILGWARLALRCGVAPAMSIVPGVVHVTSAYYLGDLIGRGGVSSVAAHSFVPPLAAGFVAAVCNEGRARTLPLAVVTFSAYIVFGTHSLSLLWLVIFCAILLPLLTAVGVIPAKVLIDRRIAAPTIASAVGVGLAAWSLIPNLVLASATGAGANPQFLETGYFTMPSNYLHLGRVIPPEHVQFFVDQGRVPTSLYVQLPWLAIVWALVVLVCLFVLRPEESTRRTRRAGVCVLAVLALTLALAVFQGPWRSLPPLLRATQFSFRLNHDVILLVSGLVLVAATGMASLGERGRRAAAATLTGIAVGGIALSSWQAWHTNSVLPTRKGLAAGSSAPFWYTPPSELAEARVRLVEPGVTLPYEVARRDGGRVRLGVPSAIGAVAVPIASNPDLVRIVGAEVVGRTTEGWTVVQCSEPASGCSIAASARRPPSLVAGVVVASMATVAGLMMMVVVARKRHHTPCRGESSR